MSSLFKVLMISGSFVLGLYMSRPTTTPVETSVSVASPVPTSSSVPVIVHSKSVLRLTLDPSKTIYLDDVVMPISVDPIMKKLKELDSSKEPIYLLIDSPGGSVLDGYQIASQIESMQAPVYTVCTKRCASMAAIIHQYGKKRYMIDRSYLMFHPASGGTEGQVPNMLSSLTTLQKTIDRTNAYIAEKSHMDLSKFEKQLAYQKWIEGEDAVTEGLADSLVIITNLPNDIEAQNPFAAQKEQKPPTTHIEDKGMLWSL